MTMAAITEHPELWACAVNIVGIVNFVTFLERTGAYRRAMREAEYGSLERDRAFLESISPIRKIELIACPLMVIHGANDPRVPVSEAEQVVEALRARRAPVEYLRYEDEGHGITRLPNRLDCYPLWRPSRSGTCWMPGFPDAVRGGSRGRARPHRRCCRAHAGLAQRRARRGTGLLRLVASRRNAPAC
jgi:acetyl esterase/lipase